MGDMTETLSQIGEKKLLQALKGYLGQNKGIIRTFSEDCAVIDSPGRFYRMYSVDALVEDVHFRRDSMPFYYLGRKALKVNLSDIASMGGSPDYYLVSIGAPENTPAQAILDIYEGMSSVGKELGVHLIGGNLTSSSKFFINITIIGSVLKRRVLLRNGAKRGDSIFVTGHLGNSAEGLILLPEGNRDSHLVMDAILAHIDPPCLVDVAQKLARTSAISSMIDLSDGIAPDLTEICRESGVGAQIDLVKLPIAPSVLYWERKRNREPRILALHGGEDYHLLFTVRKKSREMFLRRIKRLKITVFDIGRIVSSSQGIQAVDQDGKGYPLGDGFQHFQVNHE
jgi:thiamine-monophosphate kinase